MASTISGDGATCTKAVAPTALHQTTELRSGFEERGHQLEKLQFALAFALMRGDTERSQALKLQIADLGGNAEEPGT